MNEKSVLRKSMLEKRNSLSQEEVKKASSEIVEKLKSLPLINKSSIIMSYMPFGNEADVTSLNQWILDSGKQLCLPRVTDGSTMDAVSVQSIRNGLVKNTYGIMEPDKGLGPFEPEKIELILVPGVVFDINGSRIGYGKGYYDRFLKNCGTQTIALGIAYSFQVLDFIPYDEHDVRLDGIVTENKIIFF